MISYVFFHFSKILTLNEKQSDVLIQQLHLNESNDLSFFNAFNIDSEHHDVEQQHQQGISLSSSYTSNQPLDQSLSNSNCLKIVDVPLQQMIDQSLDNSPTNSTKSQSSKKFPLSYVLPKFDKSFEEAAERPSTADFGARCRKKQQLIKTIRDDVFNTYGIDFYPTSSEFDRMVVSVKNKYPALSKIFGEDMVCMIKD
jgi:hypothetical protein